MVKWASENIPPERPILQLLVDQFCAEWHDDFSQEADTQDLVALPGKFCARAMRRYCQLSIRPLEHAKMKDCCYLEHTDDELRSCTKVHMDYDADKEFGYFRS
jgi:hypothetical protein